MRLGLPNGDGSRSIFVRNRRTRLGYLRSHGWFDKFCTTDGSSEDEDKTHDPDDWE